MVRVCQSGAFFGFLVVLGFCLALARQTFYHLTTTPVIFPLSYFSDKVSFFAWAGLGLDPPTYASCMVGIADVTTTPGLFIEMGCC
jgi:hypothetical protein